jgi:hypothetical protein
VRVFIREGSLLMRTKVCLVCIFASALVVAGFAATVRAASLGSGGDSTGPLRLLASTTGFFKPKTVTTRKSGLTGVQKAKRTEQPKQGFFKSMFNPEPPPPPKTIKEWMSLKQIHP